MKSTVKSLVLFTCFCFSLTSSRAQLKKLTPPSQFAQDLRKVMEDYPNRFANITGELVMENHQSVQYKCNFQVNGAEEASITRYSGAKNITSWEALMLSSESFERARLKFKSLFQQLNNLSLKLGEAGFTLRGEYEAPTEEMKFTTALLSLHPAQETVSNIRVEVAMHYELTEWKVRVLVYEKEREDDERGPRQEN